MSLAEVAGRRTFASVTDADKLAARYVSSDKLGAASGPDRPEKIIYDACMSADSPARLHVEGGAGTGKTSLILTVIGQLGARRVARPVHPLILNTGASKEILKDPQTFLGFVIDLVATQGNVFASVDPALLAEASAEAVISTPGSVSQAVGLDAKIVNYQATFTPAVKTFLNRRSAATTAKAFEAIIEAVAKDHRPLVVIDDTDHFASSPSADGIDDAALTNLYRFGIHTLCDHPQLDLIVAIQPRFRELPAVAEVEKRFAFTRVPVASLPPESSELPLAQVLERRLKVTGIEQPLGELIDDLALAALQSAYFTRGGDLRWVLSRAHEAAGLALRENADRIGLPHVQARLAAAS